MFKEDGSPVSVIEESNLAEDEENSSVRETTKRRTKDSVFVNLFTDTNYVLRLYKEIHPEDNSVKLEDIKVQTLTSVLVNTLYNDLGFIVRDKLIMLVEAQSVWNPNITLRMLFYLSETYRRYLSDTKQSEHRGSRVKIPKPELYVLYSGNRKVPGVITLSKDFFGGKSCVDLKVKVLHKVNKTIYGQYIGFCRIFDNQRKKYGNSLRAIEETIRICIKHGYLVEYLTKHEKEVATMMNELFDEEYQRKQYNRAEAHRYEARGMAKGMAIGMAKGIETGMAKGMETGMAKGEAKARVEMITKFVENGTPLDTVLQFSGISHEQYDYYLKVVEQQSNS